jgi:hypothetical protein
MINSQVKHWLKQVRWQARRSLVSLRWGPGNLQKMPAVLGNAMPKSGSHLIIQILQGLTRLGPFVNPGFPPVNRSEANAKLPDEAVLTNIQRMRPGDIGYGYIGAQEPFLSALTLPGFATVFVYRDPRDMIVSHVFYATQMYEGHWMHRYYTETLQTMEERINAAIQGVQEPGSELTPVRRRYETYLGWLDQPQVLCLRFEDLILNQEVALGRLLDYLGQHGFGGHERGADNGFGTRIWRRKYERTTAVAVLGSAIAPRKSGTFRKGQPGNWKEHFTLANKALFKEMAGDLLIRLGYEQNPDW